MSDEMVQEKTEAAAAPPENGLDTEPRGETTAVETVSSEVSAAPAQTDEPAPAQPGASSDTTATASAPPPAADASDEVPVSVAPEPEPTPSPAEPAPEPDFGVDFGASLRQLQEGDVINGTVMRVDREGVLVDVGAKSEGIIRLNELSREPNVNPNDVVKVGETIRVFVIEPENADGNPILSKKRADFEQAWDRVQRARETGETLVAMVTDRVKGGLTVDLGIRGFVPASHVGSGSLKNNLEKYVGQTIPLKVIEVDKDRRKVVLSNKLAVQEEREQKSAETKASLALGQVRHGVVRRLTNYGAFIDLGGIDGLLHISEMSWTRINDPKEVLREGQEIDVLVLKLDLESAPNRVSLGLRQILPDPWAEIANRYKEGDIIKGTVTRIVPFGAFVQVEGGVEGIIPNNEMLRKPGGKGMQPPEANSEVEIKVIGLRPDERKMTLSQRALQPIEEREAPREPSAGQGGGGGGREGGGGGRRDRDRDRGEREDFSRYVDEEPRFTIGDALAAQRRERERRRDRRNQEQEEEVDLTDLEAEIEAEEVEGGEAEASEVEVSEVEETEAGPDEGESSEK